jgi:hypothetical protein
MSNSYLSLSQGFVVKNYEKSSASLTVYGQDLIETFAKGTLF